MLKDYQSVAKPPFASPAPGPARAALFKAQQIPPNAAKMLKGCWVGNIQDLQIPLHINLLVFKVPL
jgi:hypothetical protein